MNIRILLNLALTASLAMPFYAFSDAEKEDWFGDYSMNHDGWKGTLTIADIKADCAAPLWCDMKVSYKNSKGETHNGTIDVIDDKGQHMIFYIDFQGHSQKFDAYIFSWDKTKLAGTTIWSGRKFGFYAIKQ